MAYALLGGRRGLLPLRGAHPQEHPRLGQARLPGRRRPADQHPAGQHQAGRRPRAVAGRGRRARPVLGRDQGDPARPRSCSTTASTAASSSPSRSSPRATNYYDPWQTHAPQRPAEHRLLPHRRRRRVAAVPPRGPARADGDVGRARLRVPRLHRRPAAPERRGGERRGDRGDRSSPSTPGPTSRPSRATSTSPRQTEARSPMEVARRRPARARRAVQGRASRARTRSSSGPPAAR